MVFNKLVLTIANLTKGWEIGGFNNTPRDPPRLVKLPVDMLNLLIQFVNKIK